MKVSIDQNSCIGSALCLGFAPDVFDIDETNKAYLLRTDLDDVRRSIEEAAEMCPMNAIVIETDA